MGSLARLGGLVESARELVTVFRQAKFDLGAKGDITLRGKGIPGGEIKLEEGEYEIDWIIVNKQGKGLGANVENAQEIQEVLDELAGLANR